MAGMTLVCDSGGLPRMYELNLRPGLKAAFVTRGCGVSAGNGLFAKAAGRDPQPIDRLADRVYLRAGWRVAGKRAGVPGSIYSEDLGAIVLDRLIAGQ